MQESPLVYTVFVLIEKPLDKSVLIWHNKSTDTDLPKGYCENVFYYGMINESCGYFIKKGKEFIMLTHPINWSSNAATSISTHIKNYALHHPDIDPEQVLELYLL
jgi:hypothetical protein